MSKRRTLTRQEEMRRFRREIRDRRDENVAPAFKKVLRRYAVILPGFTLDEEDARVRAAAETGTPPGDRLSALLRLGVALIRSDRAVEAEAVLEDALTLVGPDIGPESAEAEESYIVDLRLKARAALGELPWKDAWRGRIVPEVCADANLPGYLLNLCYLIYTAGAPRTGMAMARTVLVVDEVCHELFSMPKDERAEREQAYLKNVPRFLESLHWISLAALAQGAEVDKVAADLWGYDEDLDSWFDVPTP